MPRKRTPIVERALNLLKLSLFFTKVGKPIKLILLRKCRKLKKHKLLKHYNYDYIKEYQFSPSSSPLFQRRFKKRSGSHGDVNSFLSAHACQCWGSCSSLKVDGDFEEDNEFHYGIEAVPAIECGGVDEVPPVDSSCSIVEDGGVREKALVAWNPNDGVSVDERAEMFIRRFYEEMRIQRQETMLVMA